MVEKNYYDVDDVAQAMGYPDPMPIRSSVSSMQSWQRWAI